MVKRLFPMQETRVQPPGWEDPLEKEMATHSSTLAWKIPWTEEPGRLQYMGSQRAISLSSVQFSSVAQSCPALCDPMNHSTADLRVHYQLSRVHSTHVYRVGDAIQPSHPLSSPSPLAPNPSQHQSISSVSTLHIRWPKY